MDRLAWRHRLHVMRLVVRNLDPSAPPIAIEGIEIRQLGLDEALAAAADPRFDLERKGAEEAFGRGDECVGAVSGGALVGFVWSAYAEAPDLHGVWVAVPPIAVYKYKSYVVPEMRGRRIAPALYRHADLMAARRGRKVTLGLIAVQNASSLAASLSIGTRLLGFAGYWKPGRSIWSFRSAAVRRLGLRYFVR